MRVLVVDDEPSIVELLKQALTFDGHSVEAARNGNQALEMLEQQAPFDLIITDFSMPVLNGVDLLKKIRADDRWQKTPVIVMTAYSTDDIQKRTLRAGAGLILEKPVDIDTLLALVRFAT